jgi:hypothetical protein
MPLNTGASIPANTHRSGMMISRRQFLQSIMLASVSAVASATIGTQPASSPGMEKPSMPPLNRTPSLRETVTPLVVAEGVTACGTQLATLIEMLDHHLDPKNKMDDALRRSQVITELAERSPVILGWAHSIFLRECIKFIPLPLSEKQAYSAWFSAQTALIAYNSTHLSKTLRVAFEELLKDKDLKELRQLNGLNVIPLIFQAYKQAGGDLYDWKQLQSIPGDVANIPNVLKTGRGAFSIVSLVTQQFLASWFPNIPIGVLRLFGILNRQQACGAMQINRAEQKNEQAVTDRAAINVGTYGVEALTNIILNIALEQSNILQPYYQDGAEAKHFNSLVSLIGGICVRLKISIWLDKTLREPQPVQQCIMEKLKAFVRPI